MFKGIADKARALKDKVDLSQALASTRSVADGLVEKVKAASEAVPLAETLSTTKQAVAESITSGKIQSGELLEQYWPKLEHVIVNGLLTVAEDKLKDDEFLTMLAEKAYEVLPTPVRLVLPRAVVIEFGLRRRGLMLTRLQAIKTSKEAQSIDAPVAEPHAPELAVER